MDNHTVARITHIHLKQFRCFQDRIITCDAPIVLIQGSNGTGKTSILEALYYTCYLRSFRAGTPVDLIADTAESFFIKILVQNTETIDEINVGFSSEKKLVKINQQSVSSYKELLSYCRIIAITEDDIDLIKEGPGYRRDFLDQTLMLIDPQYMTSYKRMRDTLEERNALLQKEIFSHEMYTLWTRQLWERSSIIQVQRINVLHQLQEQVQHFINHYFDAQCTISFSYKIKKTDMHSSFEAFQQATHSYLYTDEVRFKRSLFGAHLDDITINLHGKKARGFASRGQQKLVVMLLKAAQIRLLSQFSVPLILLLDDFMTDFDAQRTSVLLKLLKDLNIQLIFTTPLGGYLEQELQKLGSYRVNLD